MNELVWPFQLMLGSLTIIWEDDVTGRQHPHEHSECQERMKELVTAHDSMVKISMT